MGVAAISEDNVIQRIISKGIRFFMSRFSVNIRSKDNVNRAENKTKLSVFFPEAHTIWVFIAIFVAEF